MLFARAIAIGGDSFTRTVAGSLNMNMDEAKLLRLKLAGMAAGDGQQQQEREEVTPTTTTQRRAMVQQEEPDRTHEGEEDTSGGFALLGAALAQAAGKSTSVSKAAAEAEQQRRTPAHQPPAQQPYQQRQQQQQQTSAPAVDLRKPNHGDAQSNAVERIMQEQAHKIVGELDLCRRYYEATFPNKPVDRLIFIGGEAKNRALCTWIAREMGLAAQVGDPLVRMGRVSEIAIESGIDRRQPQPNWAVAIGLSMGQAAGSEG
jgi:cell division ATPase FtsA